MREAEIPISAGAAATIGFLRLIVDDLRRLADLDTTNVEAIRHQTQEGAKMTDDDNRTVDQTIGVLRLTVDDLRRLADLDPANAEAIRHIADQCDRQIADLFARSLGSGVVAC